MTLTCFLPDCQGGKGCARASQRFVARMKWSISELQSKQVDDNERTQHCIKINASLGTKQKQDADSVSTLPDLSMDSLAHVREYLSPKDLYAMTYASKDLMESLKIETVMKSAMLTGGNAWTTVGVIAKLVETGSIFPPNALRLLCLVNGVRCEACGENLIAFARRAYGYFCAGNMRDVVKLPTV